MIGTRSPAAARTRRGVSSMNSTEPSSTTSSAHVDVTWDLVSAGGTFAASKLGVRRAGVAPAGTRGLSGVMSRDYATPTRLSPGYTADNLTTNPSRPRVAVGDTRTVWMSTVAIIGWSETQFRASNLIG